MKKEDIPQDDSILKNFTRELSYAIDEKGNYITALSAGWEVKVNALNVAWSDIEKRIEEAKHKVQSGQASPILYFMELRLMDLSITSSYTGIWKWQIKRHIKPSVFKNLSVQKMKKYATAFNITIEELKTMQKNEG